MEAHDRSYHPIKVIHLFLMLGVIFLWSCATSNRSVDPEVAEQETVRDTIFSDPIADSIDAAEREKEELRRQLIEMYKGELYARFQGEANTLSNYYILAQQHFYAGDYENALYLINRASLIKENADILALRGNIYLALGYMNEFINHWKRALEMDPEVPLPQSPIIIRQLQNNGLIDEQLKKAF